MAEMLEYENQIFLDILQEDGLLIAAKGLGIDTVLLNLIKVYCDAGNLVLVLGATPEEEQYFLTELTDQGVTPLPRIITADNTNNEREGIYLEGGVLFVSSRILVVDLLKGRVPLANVTGFLMFKAHRILESCQEAFALRLFRQGNKTGFVKAFSNSPQSFTVGFAQVERIMKTLFVKHLYLWPRFHATVSTSLEKKKPAVVELHLPLTPTMSQIQTAALDLVHFCVKEIKRINPMLETDDITVENALSKAFHKLLQLQLDPVWHQLSSKTKQLVADLKTLRSILMCLTQSDSVRLHALLSSLRSTEYAINSSGWLMLDSAETLFVAAKKRLYDDKKNLSPESNPKWETLSEVLTEVQRESRAAGTDSGTVLVLVQSAATCTQLKQYLTLGAKAMLAQLYHRLFPGKVNGGVSASTAPTPVIEEEEEGEMFTLTQKPLDGTAPEGDASFMECTQQEMAGLSEPVIVLQQLKKGGDALSLPQSLRTLKPKYIVMYDVDITAIRQIEIYQASESATQLQVYFLMYRGSVEEQAYLTILRREKEAFEYLIREKATMVIVADQDGKSGECSELSRDVGQPASAAASLRANTRHGGGTPAQPKVVPRVIVDMREFRSELPSLLHKRGIDIEPVTLQIGDYIITPEMCVERKSINDLIGSLHSGRLYQQALAMTRHYPKPMLLIEFDQNKPFALQGRYYLSNDMAVNDITAKLQLLTIHFPKLRLVWSPSPYATAQLFHELKENREEPVGSVAASIGIEGGVLEEEARLERYNIGIQDVVSKLPGVNTKNLPALLNKGQSLDYLVTLSQEGLKEILGNSLNAEILYKALHKPVKAMETSTSSRGRGRGRGFRRRRNT